LLVEGMRVLDVILYLTIIFAFSLFVLTFHPSYKDIISLRLFSAMMLYATAVAISAPMMFVGWTSTGVGTYISSQAGDPGRAAELEIYQEGFGYTAGYQLVYAFVLMSKYVFLGKKGEINEISEHDERYA